MSDDKKDKGLPKELTDLFNMDGLPGAVGDTQGEPLEKFEVTEVESNLAARLDDVKLDYEKSRGSIHVQQQMIMELAKLTLETARSTNSPNLIKAFSDLMSKLTDVNQHMMDHHKHVKEASIEPGQPEGGKTAQTNIQQNNYFTISEIMDQVGSQYDEQDRQEKLKDDKQPPPE